MDQKVVKRNFIIIIYEILKNRSSCNKDHLNASDIEKIIEKEYGIKLNRKTTYRVIEDLIEFGADIKRDSKGYYLDNRVLTDEDLTLLIDGISSLSDLSVDYKYELAEKLYDIVGKPEKEVDYFEYDSEEIGDDEEYFWPENNTVEQLKIINEAKNNKKKLIFFNTQPFRAILLDSINSEEKQILKERNENGTFLINPYYVFRNYERENYLLFYFNINNKTFRGAVSIGSLVKKELILSEEKIDKVDTNTLFKDFDYKNFTNPSDYVLSRQTFSIEFMMVNDFGLYLTDLEGYGKISKRIVNDETIYSFRCSYKDEEDVINYFINNSDNFKVLPGSSVYDTILEKTKSLARIYLK